MTLTSPKLKDLVTKPQEKYNTIYNSLKSAGDGGAQNLGERERGEITIHNSGTNSNSKSNSPNMKDELKKYLKELNIGGDSSSGGNSTTNTNTQHTNIINPHVDQVSIYSPSNIIGDVGANGISTRVNNIPKYMPNINNNSDPNTQLDYGTPSMSSSYASAYSPF
jgi:hypothetical protein